MNPSNKSRRKKSLVGVYRFYNMTASDYGEPFGLCKKHYGEQVVPNNCAITKISSDGFMPCNKCMEL